MEYYDVIEFDFDTHSGLLKHLAGLHGKCISVDKAITTYKGQLTIELVKWWEDRAWETEQGQRTIYLLYDMRLSAASTIVGFAMLCTDPELGGHDAIIENVFVSKDVRGKGLAKMMIARILESAVERRRTWVGLRVETGSVAETCFRTLGFTEAQRFPASATNYDGELKDTTLFHRQVESVG